MTDVEARLDRLERLVTERLGGLPGDGRLPAEGADGAGGQHLGHELHAWLRAHRRPAEVLVVAGVAGPGGIGTVLFQDERVRYDLRHVATLCQALGSEVRLALLRELLAGARTTGELLTATGIDRGQLYHHLKDLFVQGLIEQPERGRYAATGRGTMAFHIAGTLPSAGEPRSEAADLARVGIDLGEDDGNGGTANDGN